MAQYDGSIRINTEIATKNAQVQLESLGNRIVKSADKVASLRSKMDALKDVQIPTQEYKEISTQIEKAEAEFNRLLEKQEQMQREGKDNGVVWERLNHKMEEVGNTIRYAKGELQDLVDSGKAFTLGSDTEKYAEMSAEMKQLNQQMLSDTERQAELQSALAEREERLAELRENAVVGNQRIVETVERIKELEQEIADLKAAGITEGYEDYDSRIQELEQLRQEVRDYNSNINQVKESYKKLGSIAKQSFEKINKSAKKTNVLLSKTGMSFKNLLKYGLGIRSLYTLFNKLRTAIKEGFSNLYNDVNMAAFKNSVDDLRASVLTLKNAFAAAFRPLVDIAIPYIQLVSDKMIDLFDMVGQFTATIAGQKTYTRAIRQTADAFKDVEKAAKGYLSPLDEINKYSTDQDEEEQADAMFEEVPISQKFLNSFEKLKDAIKPALDYAEKLKDIFKQGFFDGLGDWGYRWDSIKDSIKSIKDSLKDIFSDPAVLAAADKWARSVAYLLGSLAGSLASIGLTIATNLLGGIAKYLEQNKERIKKYLISMFDIWSEINYLFADLFQSIAYVFEAFASEQGQQLTANIIGIFADTFMGITELASKIFRDIAQIIIKPFIDNKEAFRTALEGFLGVLASVTGTIKDGIDATFDKLNEVYDAHFKPFFDSVAQGLSDLVGEFMEFWNGKVQPILDQMAADFDVLWKSHIQPLLNNVAELLGKVADLLKAIWENILQPFISWIISNVLPVILPVIQAIWDMLVDFVGYIADAISSIIDILGGIIDFLTGVFTGDWELAFQGLENIVSGFIELILGLIEGFVSLIGNIISTLFEWIKSSLNIFFQLIQDGIKKFLEYIQKNIVEKENEIKNGISSFLNGIRETWNNAWDSLVSKVRSVFESIKNVIKEAIDWITEKINSIKDTFGSIKSTVSGFFSGDSGNSTSSYSTRSISSPYAANPAYAALNSTPIPRLATGAVIPANKEFLAVLGDQKHGTNIEAPLDTIKQAQRESILEVLSELGITGNRGNNNPETIVVKLIAEGKELTDLVINNGKVRQMSTGSNPFMLGTT